MNEGVVASRYARALLKYVQEDGTGIRHMPRRVCLCSGWKRSPN